MRGGWQRGIPHEKRDYLPLTSEVLAAHLRGGVHVGAYPLLDGDRCWWLAADFDGQDALTEALMYVKAGRAFGVPVALEVSRSGVGMHAWVFFTAPVPAQTARRLGTGLLREAMAIRGKVNLASYDRLFPSLGPELGRPLADRVRHPRLSNLKELRPGSTGRSEIRILYVFDPRRSAVLLVAGDKAGKWEAWYRQAIPLAEQRYEDYLKQEDIR